MGYNERGPVSNRMRVTVGRAEVLMTEDVRDVLADAADDPNLTRAEEIRLRYAAIVESSDDAIIAKTLDGVISAWNPAAERLFGYTQSEAIGQPITMIIPQDLHEEEHEILSALEPVSESTIMKLSASPKPANASTSP